MGKVIEKRRKGKTREKREDKKREKQIIRQRRDEKR